MKLQKRQIQKVAEPFISTQGMPPRALMIAVLHMKKKLFKRSQQDIKKYEKWGKDVKLTVAEVTGLIDKNQNLIWGDTIMPIFSKFGNDEDDLYVLENNLVNIWCFLLEPIWEDWIKNELLFELDSVITKMDERKKGGRVYYHAAYMLKDKVYLEEEEEFLTRIVERPPSLKTIIRVYLEVLGLDRHLIKNLKFHENHHLIKEVDAAFIMIHWGGLEYSDKEIHEIIKEYSEKRYDPSVQTQLCRLNGNDDSSSSDSSDFSYSCVIKNGTSKKKFKKVKT